MTIRELLETMEYGPAPESASVAHGWLDAHNSRFGLFIDGVWTEPEDDRLFESMNPATNTPLAQITQAPEAATSGAAMDVPSRYRYC